jgi:hypothetical protein
MGKLRMKKMVCETLLNLPSDIIKYVTGNIWFISSLEDAWAFTFKGSDIKDQYLVILSDELFEQDKKQIRYTILHEIGHAILGHKNSMGRVQRKLEIKQQEAEADQFAKKYL